MAPDGEILVRGSGVASGYWSGGELRPVSSAEGWYHTGDIGQLDAEGNLFFKGRKKDVIVTPAGMNVYPDDLENALKAQPEVKDCRRRSAGARWKCRTMRSLDLRNSGEDAAQIIDRANQSLAEYQRIRRWIIWPDEDFPRTSTQKPRRAEIAEAAQTILSGEGNNAPVSTNGLADLILQITKRPAGKLAENADLDSDLNLSSLDRVELLSALEDRYQVDLSETRFSAVNTVGDLERMLKGDPPPRAIYHYPAWVQRWPVTWIRFLVPLPPFCFRPYSYWAGRELSAVRICAA